MSDSIQIEILPDGTLKVTTDKVSPANHLNAESLLGDIAKECGGKTERTKRATGAAAVQQNKQTTGGK